MSQTKTPYRVFTQSNFRKLPQMEQLAERQKFEMEVVSNVLPFKANNYVVDELINWDDPFDPIFALTFPQRDMLLPHHFEKMAAALKAGDREQIKQTAHEIRLELNPHPAGQLEQNVPQLKDGTKLPGMQHKYDQTVLFFPTQGQTCHAYCSFCFRWPQFVGMDGMKFAMKEADLLVQYLREHPEVTDVLFTGGDPMIMKAKTFRAYIQPIIDAKLPHLRTIRIGTKSLGYWPYKFLEGDEGEAMLENFRLLQENGLHVAIMSHFNHPRELETEAVKLAAERVLETGAQIRTQTPLLEHINADSAALLDMWTKQVAMGMIPYYLFVVRDTGAQHYFGVPLLRAWKLFRDAVQATSGICRTVRGPSMSATPGKVHVLGATEVMGEKVLALRMIQGRDPSWTHQPFFAEYDEEAMWLDELRPAFGERQFFFEDPLWSRSAQDRQLSETTYEDRSSPFVSQRYDFEDA